MGRITVFTSEDINSKQLLQLLEARYLPYKEVNLTYNPSSIHDLERLVDVPSVPHVFFNTRYVGGIEKCLKELRKWDLSDRYDTPLEKYNAEVAVSHDPTSPHLAIPSIYRVIDHPAHIPDSPLIELTDDVVLSYRTITQLLKSSISMEKFNVRGELYPRAFSGAVLMTALRKIYGFCEEEAFGAATNLLDCGVVIHLVDMKKVNRVMSGIRQHSLYTLQCLEKPAILNSYCVWNKERIKAAGKRRSAMSIMVNLHKLLTSIELESLDEDGLLDYAAARAHKDFPAFEESICEFQKLDLNLTLQQSDIDVRIAFALNLYNVMFRYACLKTGIPYNEKDRKHYLSSVKFKLARVTFSLRDWADVVLKGSSSKLPELVGDIPKTDSRWLCLYLALNVGPHAGGSRWSLPFARFRAGNQGVLDEELRLAARVFCQDNHHLRVNNKKLYIEVSTILKDAQIELGVSDNDFISSLMELVGGKKKSDITAQMHMRGELDVRTMDTVLGFHTSRGPWYNPKPRKRRNRESSGLSSILNGMIKSCKTRTRNFDDASTYYDSSTTFSVGSDFAKADPWLSLSGALSGTASSSLSLKDEL